MSFKRKVEVEVEVVWSKSNSRFRNGNGGVTPALRLGDASRPTMHFKEPCLRSRSDKIRNATWRFACTRIVRKCLIGFMESRDFHFRYYAYRSLSFLVPSLDTCILHGDVISHSTGFLANATMLKFGFPFPAAKNLRIAWLRAPSLSTSSPSCISPRSTGPSVAPSSSHK